MSLMLRCLRVTAAFAVLAVLLTATGAAAGVVTRHYEFAEPVITTAGGYDRVSIEGAWNYGDPGEPALPIMGARLLLPPGEVVSEVRVTPGNLVVLGDGYTIEPGQMQYPLMHDGPRHSAVADYDPGTTYPASIHGDAVFGRYRGYGIANVPLLPVLYDAGTGEISYYTSMEVEIITAPDASGNRATERMIRHDDATLSSLRGMIDNPLDTAQYASIEKLLDGRSLDPALAYNYLIITTDAWDDYLGGFADFRTQRGQKAGIFLKSWIAANYTGVDTQEQIRNFIIDAYNTWACDYVLLVGDGEPSDGNGIPARGFWANGYGEIDSNIAADLYYVALDGDWNNDGDGVYGEAGEEDYYPELAVGRCACSTVSDVQNFVTKTMRYLDQPVVSECDEALMVGELLWDDPTWGGTYKDEVMNGGTYNGYTTTGFPPSMNVGTLYDRDLDPSEWPKSTLISMMENGMNIVNHLGHCNVTWFMKMTNSDAASYDNDGLNHSLNFAYSQGCYGGSFDNRTTGGSYGGDCCAEDFACDDAGCVAIVTNSRYGWGDPGGTDGSSQYFDREFFDAMFAEGIYPLGYVNNDSKVDVLWRIAYGANRWCYWQLNVFGDPALHLWTAEPIALSAAHSPTVMVGQPDFEVTVLDASRAAVEGAIVTIYTDDYAVYDVGVTDATGQVTVHPNATSAGTMYVKVTAHDRLVSNTTATIAPASGVYLAVSDHSIDDDLVGDSSGNDDGEVGAGETIELSVTIGNYGTAPAYGVTATLSSSSGRVGISDSYEEFGDIAGGGFATCLDDFEFVVDADTPDGEMLSFTLTMSDASRETWQSNINFVVHAPELATQDYTVSDPLYAGNGNDCPEPGETIYVSALLHNGGSVVATGVTGTLTSSDPYVQINNGSGIAAFISPDGTATLSPDFSVTILPDAPAEHEMFFDIEMDADWIAPVDDVISVKIPAKSFADDIESGEGDWTHDNVTAGFGDEWHVETYRYQSTSHSWKFGGAGSGIYGNSMDGALFMKPVCLGGSGQMTFYHWMDAEEESSTSAWDCGLVEITTDGGDTWNTLHPNGGYSHLKNSNLANPLPEGTPCWSGTFGWRQETFDLSAYEDQMVQVRFRFASDGYVTEEGWYVDDINLTSSTDTTVPEDQILPREFALRQNVPNPFNPITSIHYQLPVDSHVRIDVYNIAGRLVRTLVDDELDAGYKTVVWDGTNEGGERVASGIYMYRMQAGDTVAKKMMVLLK